MYNLRKYHLCCFYDSCKNVNSKHLDLVSTYDTYNDISYGHRYRRCCRAVGQGAFATGELTSSARLVVLDAVLQHT